jgi:hypothetical protein
MFATKEPTIDSLLKYRIDIAVFIMTIPVPPILAIVGLVGNVFSYLLMKQKKYDKSTTCFYMRCMAAFDSLYIYGRMFLRYLLVMAPYLFESARVKEPFCKYYLVSLVLGSFLSPWLLVVMTFDRFLAITWPLKAAILCTMRRAKLTALVLFVIGMSFSLLRLATKWQARYRYWLCPYHFDTPMDDIYATVEGVLLTILPLAAVSIFNVGILVGVYRSKRNQALRKSASSSKESSITRATLLATSVFIASQIPDKINDFIWTELQGDVTPNVEQWQWLALNIVILTQSMNFCLNSYLYILPCKRLRMEMFGIILSCRSN